MKRCKTLLYPARRAVLLPLLMLAAVPPAAHAGDITVGDWTPLFVGVDIAPGQQSAPLAGEVIQQALCLRIDLSQPEIRLFTTPKCTDCGSFETRAENLSLFLERNDLQVAVNGGFYSSSGGLTEIPLGTPERVSGLAISEGVVVSPADSASHVATLLFTENNQATFLASSAPADTTGIYTAISGNRPLLIDGVNANTPNPQDRDPRTAFGLSQDNRYLYLLTIDGRQDNPNQGPLWSGGADWYETGEWLKRFGAWNGINVDGGGSTTMVMADTNCAAFRTNRSSFVKATGVERVVGHNFGVRAPRFSSSAKRSVATPGITTAIITWQTDFPSSTEVQYGPTAEYGLSTARDGQSVRHHVATLTGLSASTSYHFRVISEGESESFAEGCRFNTQGGVETVGIFGLTNEWRYTTNNLDGINWKSEDYDDAGWLGSGPGLLYVQESNVEVQPRNTPMPPTSGTPYRTYYFRTRFDFSGSIAGVSLGFASHIDDGAVFYLNGTEIRRVRMPAAPQSIANSTPATGTPCTGFRQVNDAATVCPDVFILSGNLVATNLKHGENVLAVEVHNATQSDIVFGTALSKVVPITIAPMLNLVAEGDQLTLFWNGEGFVLQESTDLGSPQNWSDVAGPVTTSPIRLTRGASNFYRLRN